MMSVSSLLALRRLRPALSNDSEISGNGFLDFDGFAGAKVLEQPLRWILGVFSRITPHFTMTQGNHICSNCSWAIRRGYRYPVIICEGPIESFLVPTDGTRIAPILIHKRSLHRSKCIRKPLFTGLTPSFPETFLSQQRCTLGIKHASNRSHQPSMGMGASIIERIIRKTLFAMVPIIGFLARKSLVPILRIITLCSPAEFFRISSHLFGFVCTPAKQAALSMSSIIRLLINLLLCLACRLTFFFRSILAWHRIIPCIIGYQWARPLSGDKLRRVLQHPAAPAHLTISGSKYNILCVTF
jgi:hypothetical protein